MVEVDPEYPKPSYIDLRIAVAEIKQAMAEMELRISNRMDEKLRRLETINFISLASWIVIIIGLLAYLRK